MRSVEIAPALLDRLAAATLIGVSERTMTRMVARGEFPAPRKISKGRTGWLRREIDEWIEALPVSDLPPGPAAVSR